MPAVQVLMTTTVGPITLELDADNAPKTVDNFLSYVADGSYDETIFHRVIDNFMIQGGGLGVQSTMQYARTILRSRYPLCGFMYLPSWIFYGNKFFE